MPHITHPQALVSRDCVTGRKIHVRKGLILAPSLLLFPLLVSVTSNQGHSTPALTNPDLEEGISLVPAAGTSAASEKGLKLHTL